MKDKIDIQPPRWAQNFLEWYCRPELLEDLQGDLFEYFQRNLATKGRRRANLIYIIDVLKFLRAYTIRKPQPETAMNNFIVLQNYFKTSVRNISRNKLFSTINIIGLAISMSVGLLLIAFLTELKSYDKFHKNYNRIFRVVNTYTSITQDANEYASTSILAGKKIKETVSGIDEVVIIRNNFDEDLHVDDKTIPLSGIWTNDAFFKVFSFEIISGNSTNALSELNAVVLTETAAKKLFGTVDVAGKQVLVDTSNYTITAVMKDPPKHSHLQFEMLGSFVTIDTKRIADNDKGWMKWSNMWSNYVYVLLRDPGNHSSIERSFAAISNEENKADEQVTINIHLQPLSTVVLSKDMSNQIGPTFNKNLIWILGGLCFIVIASACFNYTNLSIARALRRTREVGIRKVVGASKQQVFNQFMLEAVIIAVLSLVFSFMIFLMIKPGFLSMDRNFERLVELQLSPEIGLLFIGMAVGVGLLAGFLPALFFSKMNTTQVLKNLSSVKLFKHVHLRKALIIFQYTLSILFIVSVSLAYKQYKYSISFDLGLTTENILNVDLQGNKPDLVMTAFAGLSEVQQVSKSIYVPAIGTTYSGNVRFTNPHDSSTIYYNYVDEAYIELHHLKLLAGENFKPKTYSDINDAGVIINEKLLKWMEIESPADAVGETLFLDGKKVFVIGVIKDFHHNTLNNPIDNFAFRYYNNNPVQWGGVVNLKVQSSDIQELMNKIEAAWKQVDPVHPLKATFYKEKIKSAYKQYSGMIVLIGSLAVLAISIASLGLLGMVVFTTETRLKEISIRKVLGASEQTLVLLMSKGFIILLAVACIIAIPIAYYIFDQILFSTVTYRAPIGFIDLFAGALLVIAIALLAISSQTLRVARVNPASILRSE